MMVAKTFQNDAATIRIHDDFCNFDQVDTVILSKIVSDAYARRMLEPYIESTEAV